VGKHFKVADKAFAVRGQMLTVMAMIALIGTLSCKRFKRAIADKKPIPSNLKTSLSNTLGTCKEMNLTIPGSLQAKALHFCSDPKTDGQTEA